jgi:Tfp pilus assembly protein FimT
MVVLAVLGILSALIVPQFGTSMEDSRLTAAGRELVSVMNLAYSQAVTKHAPCRLRIDREKSRYWLESPIAGGFEPVDDVPGAAGSLDRKISVQVRASGGREAGAGRSAPAAPGKSAGDVETIAFRPDGTADPREVILRDGDGFGLSIEVHPITSRIRIDRLERLEER